MPQTYLIIETVCKLHAVTPHEFATGKGFRVIDCRHLVVIALLENSRLSVHQVAELLSMKLSSIKTIRRKLCNCDKDGDFYIKYLETDNHIKNPNQ